MKAKQSRVSGSPEEKRKLIGHLDAESFPHLVADILHFVRGHTEVRVVDGPGDGRRDISSKNSSGGVHIAQTKYHADPDEGVGARELDEIVIVLGKFGAKCGLFATTGRISPQAKREYLDQYPGLTLEFLEGNDIVDEVLAHPTLAQVWCEGERISASARPLVIPMVLRDSRNDIQVARGPTPRDLTLKRGEISYSWGAAPAEVFAPYRPTSMPDPLSSRSVVRVLEATFRGATHLHEIEDVTRSIVEHVALSDVARDRTLQARVGLPCFERPDAELIRDRVNLEVIGPTTYVLASGVAQKEYDWVVPVALRGWVFPEGFGSLEADWVGWYEGELDTVLMVYVRTPVSDHTVGVHEFLRRVQERYLAESLFVVGRQDEVQAMLTALGEDGEPDYQCGYGPGGV